MADVKKEEPKGRAHAQTDETKVVKGEVPKVDGEISPAADQSNRGDEMAARMALTPPKTLGQAKQEQKTKKESSTVNEEGEQEFVDPDDLEEQAVNETFPKDVCQNCRNHGRGDVKLDDRGFCKKCGFKLNRVHNIALEPERQ